MNKSSGDPIYIDAGVSGGIPLGQRPEGDRLLRTVRPGDVVVAAKMDHMFRSAATALQVIEDFKKRKISCGFSISATTARATGSAI